MAYFGAAALAQANLREELPTLPNMPLMQDCETVRAAHERLAEQLRRQAESSKAADARDEADTIASRGRILYDDCLRQVLSGGGGMGG